MFKRGVRDMIGIDETGNRHGSLTVIREADSGYRCPKGYKKESEWLCICDCGRINSKPIKGSFLRSGKRARCNYCSNEARRVPESVQKLRRKIKDRERRSDPEYKAKQRRHSRISNYKKYGLTEEGFLQLFSEQDGKCAVCGLEFTTKYNPDADNRTLSKEGKPHIDHCHDSGDVRGLLCSNCNVGLGNFKDDLQRLQSAIQYLT